MTQVKVSLVGIKDGRDGVLGAFDLDKIQMVVEYTKEGVAHTATLQSDAEGRLDGTGLTQDVLDVIMPAATGLLYQKTFMEHSVVWGEWAESFEGVNRPKNLKGVGEAINDNYYYSNGSVSIF